MGAVGMFVFVVFNAIFELCKGVWMENDDLFLITLFAVSCLTSLFCYFRYMKNKDYELEMEKIRKNFTYQDGVNCSPDVDWKEYNLDFNDRKFADTRADRLMTLMRMLTDFKIVHDYDNFHAALTDYDYTKYKAGTKTAGFTEKLNYLKQFFAVTSKDEKPEE